VPQVPPDFLLRLLALANFMRLSLLKAAHAVVGWDHVQEIRVAHLPRLAVGAYLGRKEGRSPTKEFRKSSTKSKGKDYSGETDPNR
jgi:hypothetical protein